MCVIHMTLVMTVLACSYQLLKLLLDQMLGTLLSVCTQTRIKFQLRGK